MLSYDTPWLGSCCQHFVMFILLPLSSANSKQFSLLRLFSFILNCILLITLVCPFVALILTLLIDDLVVHLDCPLSTQQLGANCSDKRRLWIKNAKFGNSVIPMNPKAGHTRNHNIVFHNSLMVYASSITGKRISKVVGFSLHCDWPASFLNDIVVIFFCYFMVNHASC